MDTIKLLVIDDNQDNLITLKALIKESFAQAEVTTAQSGKQGIEIARKQNPDLILLDIVMPEMDGYEVCRNIKSDEKMRDIPIVFITALKGDKESRIKALEAGGDAFLAKPVDQTELIAQIRAMVKVKLANAEKRDEQERLSKLVEEQTTALKEVHTATLNLLEDLQQENERRKQSEKALRQSEEMMRNSQSVAHICAYSTNLNDNEIEKSQWVCSPEFYKIFGIDKSYPHTIAGWAGLIHPDHREEIVAYHASVVKERKPFNREYKIIRLSDDAERWVHNTGELELDDNGNPVRMHGAIQDITERKRIENRLKESEETYRNIFQNAQVGLFRTRISDGKIMESNDQLARMFGFSNRQDFIGHYKTSGNYVDEGTREQMLEILKTHGFVQDFEARLYRRDKTIFYANYSARVFPEKGWIEGVAEDITERKQMELALQESEEKFRTIAEQLTDLITLTDEKGVIVYASPASEQLFGVAPKVMQGTHFTHFLDESSLSDANRGVSKIISKQQKSLTIELTMKRHDGARFNGELKAIPYRIGEKPGTLVTIRDVTERKKAEATLKESETKFRTLFETANDAIFLMDQNVFIDCNPRVLEMFGCKKEDIIGTNPLNFSPEIQPDGSRSSDAALEKINSALAYDLQFFEWKHKRLDGTLFDAEVSLNPFKIKDKTYLQAIVRDVTESKKSAELLAESEQKHRSLIEQMQEGLLVVDNDDVIQFVNPKFCEMLGYDESELLEKIGYEILLNEADREVIINKNVERQKGISEQYEISMHTKAGDEIILLMNAAPIIGKDNKVTGSMSTCVDITERKKTEIELRESEERFKALHNASFGGIAIHDRGIIMACNQGLVDMTGYAMEELVGMNGLLLTTENCRKLVMKNILEGYEKPYEAMCLRKDITEIPIRIEGRNIPYKGKVVRVSEFRDISEEKRTEKIRSMQYLIAKAILNAESFEQLLLTIRAELGQVMDTTNFFAAMYNPIADTLTKVIFEDEKDDYVEWSSANTLSGYVVKTGEKLLLTKETEADFAEKNNIELTGSPAECWLGVPLVSENKPAGVIVLQSYTNPNAYDSGSIALLELVAHEIGLFLDRKKMLTDLVEAKNQAEAGDRLKTAFMNNISHEIRTPLNGILGFGRMLAQSNVSGPERIAYLGILEKSSDRLISTITDYMDISLIASGNLRIYPESFSVIQVLKELFDKLKTASADKNLATELLLHNTPENLQMNTDRELVTKALLHLVNNAVKFTPSGKIILGCKCYPDTIEFYVKDTGIGVSDEAKQRIFQNFGQEEVSPTREYEGSGLGLSIATGIVRLLQGEIRMETKKDVGSVFTVSLPLATDETIEQLSADGANELIAETNKPLVLIAEDEESNAMYLKVILEKALCEVIQVDNGKDALEQCRQKPDISLVFMDMKMPVMNGVDATKQIKALRSDLPIIAITAHALTGDEHHFRSAGCDDYLAKPVLREMIIEKLKKYNVI